MAKIRVNPDVSARGGDPVATGEDPGGMLGPATLTRHIGYLLRRAWVLSTDCANACIPDDTPLREVAFLALLAERAPLSQRELGDLLHVNRTVMVALVDAMEAKGWVVRERNPADRRSYALRLTDEGNRARSDLVGDLGRGEDELTARLTGSERRWLNRTLLGTLDNPELAPIASLSDHCGYLIAQAHRQMRARAVERLAPIGLDPRDLGVLSVLRGQQPCSQIQLAGSLGVSPPTALGLAEELEARGLVSRDRSDSDRRVYDVRLTPLGDERLRVAHQAAAGLEAELAAELGDRYDELRRVLLKLLA